MTRYADPAEFDTALRAALADNPDLLNATLAHLANADAERARLSNAAADLLPEARRAVYELSDGELDLNDEEETTLTDMVVSAALDEGVVDIDTDYAREVYGRARWAR